MITRTDFPEPQRNMYDLAMSGKSRRAAIRCHCVMCMGFDATSVKECTGGWCPLYPYRMGGVDEMGVTEADNLLADVQG